MNPFVAFSYMYVVCLKIQCKKSLRACVYKTMQWSVAKMVKHGPFENQSLLYMYIIKVFCHLNLDLSGYNESCGCV